MRWPGVIIGAALIMGLVFAADASPVPNNKPELQNWIHCADIPLLMIHAVIMKDVQIERAAKPETTFEERHLNYAMAYGLELFIQKLGFLEEECRDT